jgi:Transcriptional regulator containing PAS, AAA-type ATPase, and DNA-binding domains
MDAITNQKAIALNRKKFLAGRPVDKNLIRPEILSSWIRCKNYGLDPYAELFPPPLPKEITHKIFDDNHRYRKKMNKVRIDKEHELADQWHMGMFYINDDAIIIVRAGNNGVLDKLKVHNISFGANISEQVMGTTAYVLARESMRESWVFGAEHYSELLQDYVSAAVSYPLQYRGIVTLMFITPLAELVPSKIDIIDYILKVNHSVSTQRLFPEIYLKNQLLDLNTMQQRSSQLFVDADGILIDVNQRFINIFKINPANTLGKPLDVIFPEFKEAVTCLKTKKTLTDKEIMFRDLAEGKNVFFMDCQPINNDEDCVGMAITLSDRQSIQKMARKVVNLSAHYTFDDLKGSSLNFIKSKKLAQAASAGASSVLLFGESGTGKELYAQAIHNASDRQNKPFVSLNCAAIPRELIGSELFGYVEGAFTGTRRGGSPGKFELADSGTLFLDEIAEMPIDMQAVLLRVLEEKKVTRLGSNNPIAVDVKIISATNRDLYNAVKKKLFREDLYYRLNVLPIWLVPLRERAEDIPELLAYFASMFAAARGQKTITFSPAAVLRLQQHTWPGNVRELRNLVERWVNLNPEQEVGIEHLPEEIRLLGQSAAPPANAGITNCDSGDSQFSEAKANEDFSLVLGYLAGKLATTVESSGDILSEQTLQVMKQLGWPAGFNSHASSLESISGPLVQPQGQGGSGYKPDEGKQTNDIICNLNQYEPLVIKDLLRRYKGNKAQVANKMGISRQTLYNKMRKYGIGPD